MRRALKLVFHEHRISCPYCRTALLIQTIVFGERNCPKCGKGFVIENNIAKPSFEEKAAESLKLHPTLHFKLL